MQISRVSQLALVFALMMMTDIHVRAACENGFRQERRLHAVHDIHVDGGTQHQNPLTRHRRGRCQPRPGLRGLTLVTSDADLAIAAHAATEERTRDTFYNGGGWRGGGWSWFGGSDPDTATGSQVGTLVVELSMPGRRR